MQKAIIRHPLNCYSLGLTSRSDSYFVSQRVLQFPNRKSVGRCQIVAYRDVGGTAGVIVAEERLAASSPQSVSSCVPKWTCQCLPENVWPLQSRAEAGLFVERGVRARV